MENKFSKFKNFIKKEGFYVILFVCLCVVAVAVAFTIRSINNKNLASAEKEKTIVSVNDKENAKEENLEESVTQKPNAEQVKNNDEKENNVTVPESKTVANTANIKFSNPIENGAIVREFSDKPVYSDTLEQWVVDKGVSIKAEKGNPVLAAAEGKVVESGEGDGYLGNYVKIAHPNGLYTVYSNLDSEGLAKKDTVVKAKQQIGKVGTSAANYKFEKYGDHLGLQMIKNSPDNKEIEQINPSKYIKFSNSSKK